ncbi:MAG: ABC transporter ATP-binding protein [Candidatus Aminicenantes bacterium]|nr:ABC transporter ATP-binding protein [Candidatus Aminicenantes bacterium]
MNNKKEILKFFLTFQKPYVHLAAAAGVLLLINVLLQLPMPLITRHLIDKIIPSKNFEALNIFCIVLIGFILIRQLSNFGMRMIILKYKLKVRFDLERDLYLNMQELPLIFFIKRQTGYLLSRVSEISSIEAFMADTFLRIAKDILTLIVGAILILKLHFKLGIFCLSVLPFFVLSITYFHKKLRDVNKILHEKSAEYTGKLEQNLSAIEKIKTSVKEKKEGERISASLLKVVNIQLKAGKLNIYATLVSAFIALVAPFAVLWFGVSEIMHDRLTLGTFFAINSFLGYLFGPAQSLTEVGYILSKARAGIERVYEIFTEPKEPDSGEKISRISGIEFRGVDFSYNGEDKILDNINLSIKEGEKIAIVGRSGTGKSTLVKMIQKLFLPQQGAIYISGKNIEEIERKSLRSGMAYVSQSLTLLDDDISERKDNEDIKKVLKKFKINIEEKELHQKELSGGEVQRLEIADSLLKGADLLIVDEGTSHLDYEIEKTVIKELFDKYADKTIIFIAHRLNSISSFERILVLEGGKIAEQGAHKELLKKKGVYWTLWNKQDEPL